MPTLVDQIRRQLQDDYCRPDAVNLRIPPERALVKRFAVSRETVRRAMSGLVREGYVRRYRGKGTFVSRPGGSIRHSPARSATVGLVTRHLGTAESGPWVTEALERLREHDALAMVHMSHSDPFREVELLQQMLQRNADGILLQPCFDIIKSATLDRQAAALELGRAVPLVMMGDSTLYRRATKVWIDDAAAAETATEHLIALGRSRIAHVGSRSSPPLAARTAGYHRAMKRAGLDPAPGLTIDISRVPHSGIDLEMARNAATLLLTQDRPPDAVFCYWTEVAVGVVQEALARGLRVPQDLAVIGIAHVRPHTAGNLPMPISTVWYDLPAIAARAAEELLREISGAEPGRTVHVPHELRPAASTVGG